MRNVTLALLTLTGLLVFSQQKAQATEYPYCNHHVIGWGVCSKIVCTRPWISAARPQAD